MLPTQRNDGVTLFLRKCKLQKTVVLQVRLQMGTVNNASRSQGILIKSGSGGGKLRHGVFIFVYGIIYSPLTPNMCRYYSPYPLADDDDTSASVISNRGSSRGTGKGNGRGAQGSKRGGTRGRGRLEGSASPGDDSILWVCDRCFKYMRDGAMLELHLVITSFERSTPLIWLMVKQFRINRVIPFTRLVKKFMREVVISFGRLTGRKKRYSMALSSQPSISDVYQLFCQNLSLFGKLFIDVKTLFFDCDNCQHVRLIS